MHGIIIDRLLNGFIALQLFDMLNQKVVIKCKRMIIICFQPFFKGKMGLIFIIIILLKH
ncbi:Uncharacterised protein [Mycobacteroides abscessus subsp. abscessus]|nr:Uncharacterised protein [Mycobacteroides abscessus subsp. abscessus]